MGRLPPPVVAGYLRDMLANSRASRNHFAVRMNKINRIQARRAARVSVSRPRHPCWIMTCSGDLRCPLFALQGAQPRCPSQRCLSRSSPPGWESEPDIHHEFSGSVNRLHLMSSNPSAEPEPAAAGLIASWQVLISRLVPGPVYRPAPQSVSQWPPDAYLTVATAPLANHLLSCYPLSVNPLRRA